MSLGRPPAGPVPDAVRDDLGDAVLVARTELRRSWRTLFDDSTYRAVKALLVVLGVLLYAALAGASGFLFGAVLGDGFARGLTVARAAGVGLLVFVAFFAVQRTVKTVGWPDAPAGVLTAASPRAVALGLLLAETGRVCAFLVPMALAAAVGFGVGTGRVVAVPVVFLVAVGVVATAVASGFAAGLAAKNVAARSAFVARHRTAVGFLGAAAFPLAYSVALAGDPDPATISALLSAFPVAWVGDPAVVAAPAVAPPAETLAVGAALLVAGPPLLAGTSVRLARALWFTERVDRGPDDDAAAKRLEGTRLERALAGRVTRPARRVALKSLRRALRAPFTVQYAVVPAFFLFYEVQMALVRGLVPPRLPVVVAAVGALGTGSLYTLNPMGNEESVLPVTLTTGVPPRQFLGGLVLGEAAIGVPVTALAVTAVGVVAPLSVPVVALDVVGAALLCVCGAGVAAALGVRYPKREPTTVTADRQVVVPSPWAFFGFLVAMSLLALPAVLAHLKPLTAWGARTTGASWPAVRVAGLVLSVVATAVAGIAGFRRAVRGVEGYRL